MRSDAGFTLVELLIALALGGLLVLMAHRAFGATADFSFALRGAQTAHDERMATHRELSRLFGSIDAADSASAGFHGGEDRVVSSAWRHGVLERFELALADGRLVLATASDTIHLMRSTGFAAEYLLDPGAQARWMKGWQSPVSAPLAVRLRIARADSSGGIDTLLIAIGQRG